MLVLGLSPFKHDAAAALLEDGVIKAAIENDKLVRTHTAGVPEAAIRFCLEKQSVKWQDLDAVAITGQPFQGWRRRAWTRARLSPLSPVATAFHEANELGTLARELNQVRMLSKGDGPAARTLNYDHHLCHAAGAFFLSPFDRALVLTLDEEGDGRSGMLAVGEGTSLRVLRTIPFPHSLAWIYSQVTRFLGFVPHKDEHKTQWLGLEGTPRFKNVFLEMFWDNRTRLPRLNRAYVNIAGRLKFSAKFFRELGLSERNADLSDELRRDLATSLRQACAEAVALLLEHYQQREGIREICLGGGLFQNTLLVSDLEQRLGSNQIFVPPAPGNAGCALGAGLLAWHQLAKSGRGPAVHQVSSGPSCRQSDIKDVLDNCKARYSYQVTEDRKLDATLQLLQGGKIVGWVQGPAEFGTRALGNRSLLASPWAPYVRENLNDYIKHREWFRPFALSVTEDDCHRYFECSDLCRSMNSLGRILPGVSVLPEDFVLPGGLVRLHVVREQSSPLFWRLLKRFGENAPAPLLVNTSFNLFGEPLVVRPRDAVRSYFCSGIDALVIENFVLSKTAINQVFTSTQASLARTG